MGWSSNSFLCLYNIQERTVLIRLFILYCKLLLSQTAIFKLPTIFSVTLHCLLNDVMPYEGLSLIVL